MDLPQQETIVQYVADGVENEYVFAFYVPTEADIAVYTQAPNATPVPESDIKILNVDYTVSFNEDPITGGKVTFLTGHIPASGYIITLNRDVQASLDVQFSKAQNFNGANLDAALERLLLLIQQNKTYALQRNLSYRVNTYLPDLELESNTQLQTLQDGYIWKGQNGGVISTLLEESPDVGTLRTDLANDSPGTAGANLVGYYSSVNGATTVNDELDTLSQGWITGDVKPSYQQVASGWLPLVDEDIGSAASGAYFSSDENMNLFILLWNTCNNTACPVSGGRGESAAADWAANKKLSLPLTDGRTFVNLRGFYTPGEAFGEASVTLTESEMPSHHHYPSVDAGSGGFAVRVDVGGTQAAADGSSEVNTPHTGNTGGGLPHNNLQPSTAVFYLIKL